MNVDEKLKAECRKFIEDGNPHCTLRKIHREPEEGESYNDVFAEQVYIWVKKMIALYSDPVSG